MRSQARGGGGYNIPSWSDGTDAEIVEAIWLADSGQIDLTKYWTVGDERTVHLSAMAATGVGESHVEQDVTFVLMDSTCTGFTLANPTANGKTTPNFIVGMKNCLLEQGYMNSTNTNTNGWSACARRAWCNDVFRMAVPTSLRNIFKQFKWKQGQGGGNASGLIETIDYFGFAPEKAIFGSSFSYAPSDESALYEQWSWYKTDYTTKKLGDTGSVMNWWTCSPYEDYTDCFCTVLANSIMHDQSSANATRGISPFGCI